jgi:molecular chaperone GrpE
LAAIPPELHDDERIASIITGLESMDANLLKTFERHGIKKIEPLDETFNPNFHEVMFEAPVPGKAGGIVIQVVEAGYVIADRLLRAAKVGISKGGPLSDHQVDKSA